MRDHAPTTIQRLLALRQFDPLSEIELSELATVAENLSERTLAPGSLIVDAGSRFAGAYFIVQGCLEGPNTAWGPRSVVGGTEMIAARPSTQRILATEPTRVLLLPATSFADLLEDNYGVLSTTLRSLSRFILPYGPSPFAPRPVPRLEGRELGMVDRILMLRARLPLASGNLQAVSSLAQACDEVVIPAGATIHMVDDSPSHTLLVLEGEVRQRRSHGAESIASAATMGFLEALADARHLDDAQAVTDVRALRLPNVAVFDVMEDHTDFAIALARRLARELLDLQDVPADVN